MRGNRLKRRSDPQRAWSTYVRLLGSANPDPGELRAARAACVARAAALQPVLETELAGFGAGAALDILEAADEEVAVRLADSLIQLACSELQRYILRARDLLVRIAPGLPEGFVESRTCAAMSGGWWQYRRGLELLEAVDLDAAERVARSGLTEADPDVREAAEDMLRRLGVLDGRTGG
jgi:hypothetical protein